MRRPSIVASALLALGCSLVNDPANHMGGGADGGTDGGPASVAPNEFCQRFAEFACEAFFDCCPSAPADPSAMDRTQCMDQAEFDCTSGFGSLITDSRTGYDSAVAAEVLAEARAYLRDAPTCDTAIMDWYVSRRGFQRVLSGTVGGGGDCTPRSLDPANPDTAAFFSCESRDQACFVMSADRWLCADRQPVDGDCVFYFDCEEGLACRKGPLALMGTCQERLADGMIGCRDATDCRSLICSSGTCQPRSANIFCGLRDGPPGG